MIALFLALSSARAEPVEARPTLSKEGRPSTSSGRTEKGEPQSAIDAERAFAADAQKLGQWTAFRKWAAPDGIVFTPEPANARTALPRTDPPKAIVWWPTANFVSCDGKLAVNTGGWTRPDGSVGYFTTVWKKQPNGQWRWTMDHGDTLKTARPVAASPVVRRASCEGKPSRYPWPQYRVGGGESGTSPDGTLAWHWFALGDRTFTAMLWNGRTWDNAVFDRVVLGQQAAAPKP